MAKRLDSPLCRRSVWAMTQTTVTAPVVRTSSTIEAPTHPISEARVDAQRIALAEVVKAARAGDTGSVRYWQDALSKVRHPYRTQSLGGWVY